MNLPSDDAAYPRLVWLARRDDLPSFGLRNTGCFKCQDGEKPIFRHLVELKAYQSAVHVRMLSIDSNTTGDHDDFFRTTRQTLRHTRVRRAHASVMSVRPVALPTQQKVLRPPRAHRACLLALHAVALAENIEILYQSKIGRRTLRPSADVRGASRTT